MLANTSFSPLPFFSFLCEGYLKWVFDTLYTVQRIKKDEEPGRLLERAQLSYASWDTLCMSVKDRGITAFLTAAFVCTVCFGCRPNNWGQSRDADFEIQDLDLSH